MKLVVMHDLGSGADGSAWHAALAATGFDEVVAPDLPGHGDTPPPLGGNYTKVEGARAVAAEVAAGLDLADAVIVGVGASGWSATVLALAWQGTHLVLVDGLGTPWLPAEERNERRRATLRALAADESAHADAVAAVDPRLRHEGLGHGDEQLVRDAAARITMPTLLIGAEVARARAVAGAFSTPATVIESDPSPAAVAPLLGEWLAGR